MMRKLTILMLAAVALGCGSRNDNGNSLEATGLNPTSPNVVYAQNWSAFKITANFAVTKLDNAAHFSTTRNACGKTADGIISLNDWNALANAANAALAAPPLPAEKCQDITGDFTTFKFDGTAEVLLNDNSDHTLLEVRGQQICHTIGDPQAATQLINAINLVVMAADKQDCPNGWGSG